MQHGYPRINKNARPAFPVSCIQAVAENISGSGQIGSQNNNVNCLDRSHIVGTNNNSKNLYQQQNHQTFYHKLPGRVSEKVNLDNQEMFHLENTQTIYSAKAQQNGKYCTQAELNGHLQTGEETWQNQYPLNHANMQNQTVCQGVQRAGIFYEQQLQNPVHHFPGGNNVEMYNCASKKLEEIIEEKKKLCYLPSPSGRSINVLASYHECNAKNASPRFLRSTLYRIPISSALLEEVQLTIGLVISPFALPSDEDSEEEVSFVITGPQGPVRCERCQAYMNPYVKFIEAGCAYKCPFCSKISSVPNEYFNHLDVNGKRTDRFHRPELSKGIYDFQPPLKYLNCKASAFIFAIEVSHHTVSSNFVDQICANLIEILRKIPSSMRIAFLTYDSAVHFYNFSKGFPTSFVVTDVNNMFLPSANGFLVDPRLNGASIKSLLSEIPKIFSNTQQKEIILVPVIEAALEILKSEDINGKLIIFHASLPTFQAPGKLKDRLNESDRMAELLQPQNYIYSYAELGKQCASAGCGVDLFMFNSSYVDLATIGQLCRFSSGDIYDYSEFTLSQNYRLLKDVEIAVTRVKAFNVMAKVRTSLGIEVDKIYGNCSFDKGDIQAGSMTSDQTIAVSIKVQETLPEDGHVYIQTALWYVTLDGHWRIRIMNLKLVTTNDKKLIFGSCDLDTLMNIFLKQAVVSKSSPQKISDHLKNRAVKILTAYRNIGGEYLKSTQLLLPKTMELFPLFLSCLLKTPALLSNSVDLKSFHRLLSMSMTVKRSLNYIYPRVTVLTGDTTQVLRCTKHTMDENHMYLIKSVLNLYIWIGRNVSPTIVKELFGIEMPFLQYPNEDNTITGTASNIMKEIDSSSSKTLKKIFVQSGDSAETHLRQLLYEDQGPGNCDSYMEFIIKLHKKISENFSL